MGIFSKIKKMLHSLWMPYEVTYLGDYDAKVLQDSDNPAEKLAQWQAENEAKLADLLPQIQQNEREKLLMERFFKIPERQRKVLSNLAKQYSGLNAQKKQSHNTQNQMKEYLSTAGDYVFDESLPRSLRIIEENEIEFQKAQHDLSYLEGEKSALEYEFRRYQIGYRVTGITLYLAGIVAIIGTIVLFGLSKQQDTFLPAVVLILSVAFFGAWAAIFRRYFWTALEKNRKLQQRAVKLTNRVKINYVRYRNLLDYEYKKFETNSSEGLRFRYEAFIKEKAERSRYEELEKQYRLTAIDIAKEFDKVLPERESDLIDIFLMYSDYFATEKGAEMLHQKVKEENEEFRRKREELEKERNRLLKMKELF